MAHPYQEHKQHKVERSRVASMTKNCRASGGRVHEDEAQDRKLFGKMLKETKAPEGKKAKHRRDRVMRAKGGKVKKRADGGKSGSGWDEDRSGAENYMDKRARGGKVGHKKGATHVNVIVNGGKEPVPVPVPAGGPPMPPPAMGAPPPGPVAGLGGPPPPGMGAGPPGTPPMPGRARGGKVKSGPAWEEGRKAGTQVSHRAGKATTNTPENLDRGRPITFATGGGVVSFRAYGGRAEAPKGMGGGPKLPGGTVAGETRIAQAGRAKRGYAKPMKETDGAR
jgi:hypothetical protein